MGLIRAGAADPDLFDIKDEYAAIIKWDFSGLPGGFVAVVRVLPVEAAFIVIVIGGDSLFDACQGGSMDSEVSIF